MAQPTTPLKIGNQLQVYEQQLHQVQYAHQKYKSLKTIVGENAFKSRSDEYLDECRALKETMKNNPPLNEALTGLIAKCERLQKGQLSPKTPVTIRGNLPQDPKITLLPIVNLFKNNEIEAAMWEFNQFQQSFPETAKIIYGHLWLLCGSPRDLHPDFGALAMNNKGGFYAQNAEKAEAIMRFCSSTAERLSEMMLLFQANTNDLALSKFKEFYRLYPKHADCIFGKLWEVCGKPTPQTHPQIAHDQFGKVAFLDTHPKGCNATSRQKAQAIEWVLPYIEKKLSDGSPFGAEEHRMRRDLRSVEVVTENLGTLKSILEGFLSNVNTNLENSIQFTQIYKDGGRTSPKAPRTSNMCLEVLPMNCVTIAHKEALESKVYVMNFANDVKPGGAYMTHSGSQEEELFRCTAIPLVLDQQHGVQKNNFYPIHQKASGSGGVYTPGVPLFRKGVDEDYQTVASRAIPFIDVGTFAAFDKPDLDYSDPNNPRLRGEQLRLTREKIRTCLWSAYENGNKVVILGAFGCGAFANPPRHVAELMLEIIKSEYTNCFKKIIFAVMKDSQEGHRHNPKGNFAPFADVVRANGGKAYDISGKELV